MPPARFPSGIKHASIPLADGAVANEAVCDNFARFVLLWVEFWRDSVLPSDMIRPLPQLAIVANLLCFSLIGVGAQTSVTSPMGFTSVTVGPGKVAALSLPLDPPAAYVAGASAVTTNTLQTTGANWTTNAYGPFATNPHVVRLLSGASKGRQFRVASNTADTLTLTTGSFDLTSVIAREDRYEILRVNTLQSVFGATAPQLRVDPDPSLADNVLLRGSFGWLTYYNNGTRWLRQGAGTTDQGTTAIAHEQGFLLVRRGATAFVFARTGAVPVSNLKTDLRAARVTSFANRFPVDTTLAAFRLNQLPGWRSNTDPAAADTVLLRGDSGWLTYYYDGANWLRVESGTTPQDPAIPIGTSVLVARRPGTDLTLDQPVPY